MTDLVYLHGLGCTTTSFNYLASELCQPSHLIEYSSSQAVEDSYRDIMTKLDGLDRFSIVGHSLGGIIGKLIALRNPKRVKHLISISTPFGGSRAATALQFLTPSMKVLRDITPSCAIISEMAGEVPNFTSIISVGGHIPFLLEENDGVVSVESQRASNAKLIIERPVNHFEVLLDEVVVQTIEYVLSR